jgi:hypothetical protein
LSPVTASFPQARNVFSVSNIKNQYNVVVGIIIGDGITVQVMDSIQGVQFCVNVDENVRQ